MSQSASAKTDICLLVLLEGRDVGFHRPMSKWQLRTTALKVFVKFHYKLPFFELYYTLLVAS